jgi:hypothetical protein
MTPSEQEWAKIQAMVDRWYRTLGHARRITAFQVPSKYPNEQARERDITRVQKFTHALRIQQGVSQ